MKPAGYRAGAVDLTGVDDLWASPLTWPAGLGDTPFRAGRSGGQRLDRQQ